MPLRDHFRPPVSLQASWDGLHGMWPSSIVRQLREILPKGYVASPSIHLGSSFEVDVATYERDDSPRVMGTSDNDGGVATALWAPPTPTVTIDTDIPDVDEYEVRVYDAERGRQLVAAIELVSPGNKDRSESRNAFVGKCAALMKQGVAVSIVDIVTIRQHNLFTELLEFLDQADSSPDNLGNLYAVSCRWTVNGKRRNLQAWPYEMAIGKPLPSIPLWLSPEKAIRLDLEKCYEQACNDLWIT